MPERQYEILIVGRANGDLILGPEYECKQSTHHPGIQIRKGKRRLEVLTEQVPTKDTDKVTALTSIDGMANELDFLFHWGGGAINSARALADIGTTNSQMGLTVLVPNRPDLFLAGKHHDLIAYLNELGIKQLCMNFQPLTYNLVGSLTVGKEKVNNKIIIRNRQPIDRFTLQREHKGTIEQYLNPSKGVLINSLDHPEMTKLIVQYVHDENERATKALELMGRSDSIADTINSTGAFSAPWHRKVITVVTTSSRMRRHLVNDIIPYSGIIFNHEDVLKVFYGDKVACQDDQKYTKALEAMAMMRCGIPTEHGVKRHIEDIHNNIYVTLGKDGHLVSIGENAYHLRIAPEFGEALGREIKDNKSSTTGAGDAFAAAIIQQETLGRASDVRETAAVANTAVYKFLGLNRIVHPSDAAILQTYSLRDFYKPRMIAS